MTRNFLGILAVSLIAILAFTLVTTAVSWAQGPGGTDWPCHDDETTYPGGRGPGMMGGRGGMHGHGPSIMYGDEDCFGVSPFWGQHMENHPMWNDDTWESGGMMGDFGMMQTWTPPADLVPTEGATLNLDSAVAVAEAYIAAWEDENLELHEIMQFDNHFYAEVAEVDSGRGAFEFLIDPSTATVYPEPGPNMMWNARYGMHAEGYGPGMMSGFDPDYDGIEMTITQEQAIELAQAFLDDFDGDLTVGGEPLVFYGYYTLHIEEDGAIVGMLSVNGYTEQVWLHHWHGEFIAMTGHAE